MTETVQDAVRGATRYAFDAATFWENMASLGYALQINPEKCREMMRKYICFTAVLSDIMANKPEDIASALSLKEKDTLVSFAEYAMDISSAMRLSTMLLAIGVWTHQHDLPLAQCIDNALTEALQKNGVDCSSLAWDEDFQALLPKAPKSVMH